METGIDKSFYALIGSENFQFWHYHMDILVLNMNDQFCVALRTCLDTLTFDLILVKLDQKQEFLIHEKLCTPL
ncbi:hypothetical protein JOC59_001849 [Weissella beninensis]|uniref:hypothetical protein n=1 Tax=Periweissella beninensis TaxID=504936 RepID=UPI001D4762EB|nr:hypothetical protein [Periweissella beninensis]MBM7545104.1 hypothetical protein [Periweissella beninensis]